MSEQPSTTPSAGRKRGRPPSTARREEIVAAALTEFATRGYQRGSLAAVAERVGITQQGLLHHFPTKEDLLVEVLRRRDEVDRHDFDGLDDASQVREVVARNSERGGVVRLYSLLCAEAVTPDHPAGDYFASRFDRLRRIIATQLRHGYGERLPTGANPEQAAALLVAVMDGLQLQWLHDPERVDMPELVAVALRALGVSDQPAAEDGRPPAQ